MLQIFGDAIELFFHLIVTLRIVGIFERERIPSDGSARTGTQCEESHSRKPRTMHRGQQYTPSGTLSLHSFPAPMYSLNRIHLIGYQTQPVTVRQTPGGTSVTDLNLVVPVSFASESGEQLQGKSFHTVTLWGALAEVAGQFIKPGAQVFVAGRLQTDSWDDEKTNEKRSRTKVVGGELILLDPKSGQLSAPQGAGNLTACVNRAEVLGNVTRDPEMRTTTSGRNVLTLGVATNESWKDKASGERKDRTEFHNVVIWGELAEQAGRNLKKGMKVYVSGRVQTRSWETQAGAKRTTTEIIADMVTMVGVKNDVASESIQTDGAPRAARETSAENFAPEPTAVMASVPDIDYAPEIKVEDLPF